MFGLADSSQNRNVFVGRAAISGEPGTNRFQATLKSKLMVSLDEHLRKKPAGKIQRAFCL
jgi:hypothetical protein